MLQKSNYYLTRNKDKWQIFYITNARPAHTGPVFTWHWTTNPPLAFTLLAQTSFLTSQRFWFFRFEVRKWYIALHSFAVLKPSECNIWISWSLKLWIPTARFCATHASMQMCYKVHKRCFGKDVLTHSTFEDLRWANTWPVLLPV